MYTIKETDQVGEYYIVPKKLSLPTPDAKIPWQRKIWNSQEGKFLQRTGRSWLLILLFYFLFYLILCLFVVICYVIFNVNLSKAQPRRLRAEPGLMFAPVCERMRKYPYVVYNVEHKKEIKCLVKSIESMLKKYGAQRDFGDCLESNQYGYVNRTPCIFIKINRVIGFKLDAIRDEEQLPDGAPEELSNYLRNLSLKERRNQAWLSCKVTNDKDINYFMKRSFPAKVLELEKKGKYSENEMERIIAVQPVDLPVNEWANMKCYVWANNIEQDTSGFVGEGYGYIRVKFYIEAYMASKSRTGS